MQYHFGYIPEVMLIEQTVHSDVDIWVFLFILAFLSFCLLPLSLCVLYHPSCSFPASLTSFGSFIFHGKVYLAFLHALGACQPFPYLQLCLQSNLCLLVFVINLKCFEHINTLSLRCAFRSCLPCAVKVAPFLAPFRFLSILYY